MKLTISHLLVALPLALGAIACGGDEEASAQDSNVTATKGGALAACNGRKECVRAAVLATLFASNLEFESVPDGLVDGPPPKRAAELVARVGVDAHSMFEITTSAGPAGATKVELKVFTVRASKVPPPENLADCESCALFEDTVGLRFSFTIKNDKIVESRVPLGLAG
jgi:hypothetical protein